MFRFEHPQHFYLLLALPLLWLLLFAWKRWQNQALSQLGQVERVFQGAESRRFWIKNILLSLSLILLSIACANPQRGAKMQTATQSSSDVLIVMDISQSMLCTDVQPSRLKLAQIFAEKLVKALEGERVGLIFFAGNAYLQMPLSTDYGFILQQIREAGTDQITEQGTAIPAALQLAMKAFEDSPGGGRAIVLITDGENHDEDALNAAEKAFDDGIVLYAVGAGTAEGGTIPMNGPGQFKRDESNNIVRTKLNESLLRKIAISGGGKSFLLGEGDRAISTLQREINGLEKREMSVRSYAEFESWYQWFLLPALLLLFLDGILRWNRKPPTHS